jgi:hypothetical protein
MNNKSIPFPKSLSKKKTTQENNDYLEKIRLYGEQFGYTLKSTTYISTRTLLDWEDPHGNFFQQTLGHLKKYGFNLNYKNSIQIRKSKEEHFNDINEIITRRGGVLISDKYEHSSKKLIILDQQNNRFEMTPSHLRKGHWSPYQSSFLFEDIVRQCFEFYFNAKFPLTNGIIIRENNKNLQLDGYNDNILINNIRYKIGFEYQGIRTHRIDKETIERDQFKKEYCKQNNIHLIVIDPIPRQHTYEDKHLINLIISSIKEILPIDITINIDNFKIDFSNIAHCVKFYNKLKEEGIANGFELLSSEYKTDNSPLKWKHITSGIKFERSPSTIRSDGWPKMDKKFFISQKTNNCHYNELTKYAKLRGGKIISEKYTNRYNIMEFEDIMGNRFFTSAGCIKMGCWSPHETNINGGVRIKLQNNDIKIITNNNIIILECLSTKHRRIKQFNDIIFDWTKYPEDGLTS